MSSPIQRISLLPGILAIVLAGASAQPPAALAVVDQTLGTTAQGPGAGALIPFHLATVHLSGPPSAHTLLALSTTWPSGGPMTYQGIPIGVDLNALSVVWDGFSDPSAPMAGATGSTDIPFFVPETVPIGTFIHAQALLQAPGGPLLISNHLDLRVSGEPLVHLASGSQSSHPLALGSGGLVIADTAAAFASLWALHAPNTTPPTVNFATDFVIARFIGSFAYPNVTVLIDDVYRDGAGILQVYVTQSFGGALPPPQPTQPFDMVAVTRTILAASANEHLHINYYP